MRPRDTSRSASAEQTEATEEVSLSRLTQRLEMLDDRVDNLDTILSAVVERVMKQTLTLDIVCPHCESHLQATVVGAVKMKA